MNHSHRSMFVWFLFIGAMMTLTAGTGWAQGGDSVVEARALLATDAVHANSPAKMAVVARVATGYHINDHHPSLDYLIPTALTLDPSPQVTVNNVAYPKGTPERLAFSDLPLSVYAGTVIIGAEFEVKRGVAPGAYALKAKLGYQACNDHACLPPASVPLELMLKVVPPSVPLKPMEPEVFRGIRFQ